MWFVKNMAVRLSRAILRCFPILIVAAFLPKPFNISLPCTPVAGLMFIISLILGFLVLVAFSILIYISVFYTLSLNRADKKPRGRLKRINQAKAVKVRSSVLGKL